MAWYAHRPGHDAAADGAVGTRPARPPGRAEAAPSPFRRPVEYDQYTSIRFTDHLALEQIARSIGTVGDAYDNALMETIKGPYKAECVRTTIFHDAPYKTIADVEFATAGWVDRYNHRRLHGSLGMVSPDEFGAAYYAAPAPASPSPH